MFQIEVKLYTYHDLDLVSIYQAGQIDFMTATRQILNSYARKETYRVRLLEPNQKKEEKYAGKPVRRYYHYYVNLSEEEDADAVRLINGIAPGYRNNFVKSLLRQYFCGFFTPAYSADGNTELFDEMSDLFQGNREERVIAKKKTVRDERIPKIGEEEGQPSVKAGRKPRKAQTAKFPNRPVPEPSVYNEPKKTEIHKSVPHTEESVPEDEDEISDFLEKITGAEFEEA